MTFLRIGFIPCSKVGTSKETLGMGKGENVEVVLLEILKTQTSVTFLANCEVLDVPCELPCLQANYWFDSFHR